MNIEDNKMEKCIDCKYYDPFLKQCENDEACSIRCRCNENICKYFTKRKECKHRYEHCQEDCCVICKKLPSEKGCDYWFQCDLDDSSCDEDCKRHQKQHDLEELQTEIIRLKQAKNTIESLVEKFEKEMEKIQKQ